MIHIDMAELMETQKALQDRMGTPNGVGEDGFKENMLHAMVEITEALREINFKKWKAKKFEVDRKALATEVMDVFQFLANAALAMDLTAEDLTNALRAKWGVNGKRIDDGDCVEDKSFDDTASGKIL